ncbi:MAG: hypothetical protein LBH13_00880 [Cellulomonadaceae bacterium]|jgi:hypothetical protein|nr:hypothetical protein [Cellulomonadaceae bacterium]
MKMIDTRRRELPARLAAMPTLTMGKEYEGTFDESAYLQVIEDSKTYLSCFPTNRLWRAKRGTVTVAWLSGIITRLMTETNGHGAQWAEVTVSDADETINVIIPPENYADWINSIQPGCLVCLRADKITYSENQAWVANGLQCLPVTDCAAPTEITDATNTSLAELNPDQLVFAVWEPPYEHGGFVDLWYTTPDGIARVQVNESVVEAIWPAIEDLLHRSHDHMLVIYCGSGLNAQFVDDGRLTWDSVSGKVFVSHVGKRWPIMSWYRVLAAAGASLTAPPRDK